MISCSGNVAAAEFSEGGYHLHTLVRESYTKRRVFIGEDTDTAYYRAMDSFLRDWYLGNLRMENHTLYKFDMGVIENKRYTESWARQAYASDDMVLLQTPIVMITPENCRFSVAQGFGFVGEGDISGADRQIADPFRRDFLEGSEPAEFVIDAPRGQYELLVVSGDAEEDSVTILQAVNGTSAGGDIVKKGIYQSELLAVIQKKDQPIRLRISTKHGYRWKVNCIFLNAIKGC